MTADRRPALHSETYAVGAQSAGSGAVVLVFKFSEKSSGFPPVFDSVRVWV